LGLEHTGERLLERPIEHDRLADFRALFREHFRFVCVSLRRLGVQDGDVEDVAQEVFVVVHRKLPTYDWSRSVSIWLFGICLRSAANYRRLARHRRQVHPQIEVDVADTQPLPDERLSTEASRRLVNAALDSIEPDRRTVFVMHDLNEFSAFEIADMLSIPPNTVYSRLRVAREEFKKAVARLRAAGGMR
jgi:RNA polymerase sigma-70 factor (ECF subfamily)